MRTRPTLLVAALIFGLAFPLVAGPKKPRPQTPYPLILPADPVYYGGARLINPFTGKADYLNSPYRFETPVPFTPLRPLPTQPRASVNLFEELRKRP